MLKKQNIHLLHQVCLINKFIFFFWLSLNIIVPFDLQNPNDRSRSHLLISLL